MSSPVLFSIVLPCYNEAANLPALLRAYREACRELTPELILVNNGSTDETAALLECELAKPENAFLRTVLVPVNQGYGYGVMAGVRAARGKVIGISHADMQCDPADIFRAYERLQEAGSERVLVKGRRLQRALGPSIVTGVMAVLAYCVLGKGLTDINAQPKVFDASLVRQLVAPPSGFELDLYILYTAKRLGWRVLTIPVYFGKRLHGTSKWAFSLASRRKHIWATVKYIFRLRVQP